MIIRPLKGFGAFDAVMRRGRRFSRGPIGIAVVTGASEASDEPVLQIGVTVGRRTARTAVVRTRIRRLLREAARSVLPRYAREIREQHVTALIFVWRSAPSRPSGIGLGDVEPYVEAVMSMAMEALRTPNTPREEQE